MFPARDVSTRGILNPDAIAGNAQMQSEPTNNLIECFALGDILELLDQLSQLGTGVLGKVFLIKHGWRGVGKCFNPDLIVGAGARM